MKNERMKWEVWWGTEVEGRLAGVETLYFSPEARPGVVRRHLARGFAHVWFNLSDEVERRWGPIVRAAREGRMVTVSVPPSLVAEAREALSKDGRRLGHIVVQMGAAVDFETLSQDDEVSLRADGRGGSVVYLARVRDFRATRAADYEGDVGDVGDE